MAFAHERLNTDLSKPKGGEAIRSLFIFCAAMDAKRGLVVRENLDGCQTPR